MKKTLLVSGLALGAMVFACWGQTAPSKDRPSKGSAPGEDLAKENRDLKAYADELEKRLGELHQQNVSPPSTTPRHAPAATFPYLRAQPRLSPPSFHFEPTNPWPGGGNPFERPHQVRPYIQVTPPSTQPTLPPGTRTYRFNGEDVYVIPL